MTRVDDSFLPAGWPPEQTTTLGLVSDTHMPARRLALPDALFAALRGVDLLLHAGDVGELWVLDRLSRLAPIIAVHGNDETADAVGQLPYQQVVVAAGQRIVLTHAHYPDRAAELASRAADAWTPILERRLAFGRRAGAQIVVYGHTHVPLTVRHQGILLINPGALASGNELTRQSIQSVARLYLRDDGAAMVVHIDLAAPASRYEPQVNLDAPFSVAAEQFGAPIVTADLARRWPILWATAASAPDTFRSALLPLLHRRWAGEPGLLSVSELREAVVQAPSIPTEMRAALLATLDGP